MVLMLVFAAALAGCGTGASPEEKLAAFKQAHAAIYTAWKAETPEALQAELGKGMTGQFLKEQIEQQTLGMRMRLMKNERHTVNVIEFHELKITKDGRNDFVVYADWTIDGIREHGDVHQIKQGFREKFHVVKTDDGTWKIDQMLKE